MCSFFRKNKEYNSPLSRAFRKYGKENVELEIIEKVPREKLNEKEIYWIKHFNTFEKGYNQTEGGQVGGNKKLSNDTVLKIIYLLKKNYPYYYFREKYHLSTEAIYSINYGRAYFQEGEHYPLNNRLRYSFVGRDKVDSVIYAIKNSDYTLSEISEFYNVPYTWVKDLNAGKRNQKEGETYPLRPFRFYRKNNYDDGRPNLIKIPEEKLEKFFKEVEDGRKSKELYEEYGKEYTQNIFAHLCSKVRKWLKEKKGDKGEI